MYNKPKILQNAIKTPDGTILISEDSRDFRVHVDRLTGKNYGVDGGKEHLSRIGEPDYTDLSVYDDGTHETRRKYLSWGRNYDKNMKLLPKTEFIKIKDLDIDHIFKILQLNNLNSFLRRVFEDEIIFREDND